MKAFLLGLLAIFWSTMAMGGTLYTFNGGGTSGNWTDATIWTTDPTGSTSINSRVPANGDAVVITNSFVVFVNSAIATTNLDLTIQRGGVLDLQSAAATLAPLNSLAGQGTLRIGAPYFPSVTTNNFDDANTGTVEFYNWPAGASALPVAVTQYNNLRLLNTNSTAFTAQIDNNLTLTGGLALTRTNTTAFPDNSTYSTAAQAATGAGLSLMLGKTTNNNRTLTIQGDVSIGTGTFLGVSAVATPVVNATDANGTGYTYSAPHVINVSGNFVNNGTVNLHNGTADDTQVATLVFKSTTAATFANNGDTDLDVLRVDKGTDSQVLLNVTSTVGLHGNPQGNLHLNHVGNGRLLELVNGVTKLNKNVYLAKINGGTFAGSGYNTGYYELGSSTSSPTLWIAEATVDNTNALAFVVYGSLRVSGGLLTSVTSDAMVVREDGQILIEGGTVTVDKFRPSSTSSNHRGSFIITGGTFEATGTFAGTPAATTFARFAIPYQTQAFRMTGGTIRVANPANCTGLFHIGVNSNNAIVSGGVIEINVPNTGTNNATILTTAPLYNLTIKQPAAGGTNKAVLADITAQFTTGATTTAQPLTVLNNFTLDATNPVTFDAANLNLTIQGTFTLNSNSTYLPGTNTTIFSGGQDQQLLNSGTIGATVGSSTFNNWTINKSAGTLQLAGSVGSYSVPASATLSLLNGVLNDGGKIINVKGNMVNSASHTSGGGTGNITLSGAANQTVSGDGTGVFGNLKLSNTAAAGVVGVIFSANMSVASTLTMNGNNVLAIGANRLSLTNVLTSALVAGPGITFGTSCYIQTAGNQSDLGLQKTYGKGDTFIFPVGTVSSGGVVRYAPATIELRLATGAPLDRFGQVSISPVNSRNPFVTGTTNSLAYYWKVRSVGFGPIPAGSVYEQFTMTNADATGTLANYVPGRYLPTPSPAWTKYAVSDMNIGSGLSYIGLNAIDDFAGEFTAGEPAAFGNVTAYYSRATGNWESASTWNTAIGTATPTAATVAPGAGNPVFIGTTASGTTGLNHKVTVTAANAKAGSLVIDNGSTLDVQAFTGHNFGALPDSKVGGSGLLRIGTKTAQTTIPVKNKPNNYTYANSNEFPGGDFGSFLQANGGTVEYYAAANTFTENGSNVTVNQSITLPTSSATGLALTSYNNLWLDAASNSTITLPDAELRIFSQLKSGTASTYTGDAYLSSASTTANGNLRVGSVLAQAGGLHFNNGAVRNLTVDADVQVNSGATFDTNGAGAAVANTVTVGGSITNNGTLDFNVGGTTATNGKPANLTITGSQVAALTGSNASATTKLSTLTLNKGLGRTATLNVDVAGTLTTPTSGWLTLTNGTLRFAKTSGTLTIHNAETPYLITDNAGLTVDGSGATVTVATGTTAASDLKLAGEVRVLQGTLNVGAAASTGGSDLEYASAGAPTLTVTTGTLYVNGQIRRSVNNLDGSLRFDQSGGNVNIDGQGATAAQSNERGLFEVQGPKSMFRMSGGTLNLRRSNGRPTIAPDFYLAPDSTVVTGGLVLLGNTYTNTPATVSVSSTVPIYDLKVENGTSGSANTGLLTGVLPLTLKGSLTIGNDFSFFNANANGLPLNIYQNLVNNNTSASTTLNAGGFQPMTTTQTTSFLGGIATQSITGTASNQTVFGSLVMNTPQTNGKLQLNGTARTTGTLTLTKGTFDDNGFTLTALGDVSNSATHTSLNTGSITLAGSANQNIGGNGTGRFGNLTLNNAFGATTTANQEITKVLALTNGVLTIGSNLLWLSNTANTAVTGDATHFIRTNGIVADLGVRKSYATGATAFSFPVGTANKYTPVQLNLTANSAAGTITVQPVDKPHPSTTDPLNKELKYYWKVSSTGLSSPTINKVFAYAAADVSGTESSYKLGRFVNGTWTVTNGVVDTGLHTLTSNGTPDIDGDYTGGEASEFGTVPAFYSRNATAGLKAGSSWSDPASWTYNPDGTDSSPLPSALPNPKVPTLANPVVILSGHLITLSSGSQGAASLKLNGTLDLGTYAANNFNTVTGTGTLRIGSALFPAGNYAGFVAANTGTVDFSGAGQLPARDTYNNLNLSGGTAKLLSNLDLTLNGALTVAASTQVDNPSNQNITLNSATNGVAIDGTFNLFDGNLTTGASLTTGTTGTLNLGAGTLTTGSTLATVGNGTINQGTGLVSVGTSLSNAGNFNGNTGKVLVGQNFTNSGTYVAKDGNLEVSNNLTNTGDFTANNGEVNAGGIFSNAGTYTANSRNIMHATGEFINQVSGSFDAGSSNLVLRNNFTNQGTFTQGTSLVQFITDLNRSLNGNTTFYNLQKLGTSTLGLGTNTAVHVVNLLTIQNSVVQTGTGASSILYLDNSSTQPIVGNTLSSFVLGRLAITMPNAAGNSRVFPVGAGQRYRPVTIKNVGGSSGAVVLVEIINGAPAGSVDATLSNLSANRYYRIQTLAGTMTTPTIQLSFNTDVVDEQVNVPGNLRVAKTTGPINSGTSWATAGGAGVYSPDFPRGYTISASNLTAITGNTFFALASTNLTDNPLTGAAPLPVELIAFSAARQGSAVQVAWATASEKNSAYFVVQRSADGRTFADLTRVEALGNSTARHDYGTLDRTPLAGTSYYRLRQVDKDGTTAFSNVATVRFDGKAGEPTLVAYPNPATGSGFQLAASNVASAGGTVRVFDNVGRVVFSQTLAAGTAETSVQPTQPLASGMYFATWTTADGVKLTTKVSVE